MTDGYGTGAARAAGPHAQRASGPPTWHIHRDGELPPPREGWIFVFGSNLRGRHGAGEARVAKERFGAIEGQAEGLMGSCYGIATKGTRLEVLPLQEVHRGVQAFVQFALQHPEHKFWLTRVGCGLAGNRNEDIAPLFRALPENASMPIEWANLLCAPPRTRASHLC